MILEKSDFARNTSTYDISIVVHICFISWLIEYEADHLMLVLVLRMLRYWRISGNVISLRALKNLNPIQVL